MGTINSLDNRLGIGISRHGEIPIFHCARALGWEGEGMLDPHFNNSQPYLNSCRKIPNLPCQITINTLCNRKKHTIEKGRPLSFDRDVASTTAFSAERNSSSNEVN